MKYISELPLDINLESIKMHHPNAGGLVIFSGEAREQSHGKIVSHLEYEAHPVFAEKLIEQILLESKQKWNLIYAHAIHRIGRVDISESAVLVLTSSRHRKESFEANQSIIYRIKTEVPIWKKEIYLDKTYEWIDACTHN